MLQQYDLYKSNFSRAKDDFARDKNIWLAERKELIASRDDARQQYDVFRQQVEELTKTTAELIREAKNERMRREKAEEQLRALQPHSHSRQPSIPAISQSSITQSFSDHSVTDSSIAASDSSAMPHPQTESSADWSLSTDRSLPLPSHSHPAFAVPEEESDDLRESTDSHSYNTTGENGSHSDNVYDLLDTSEASAPSYARLSASLPSAVRGISTQPRVNVAARQSGGITVYHTGKAQSSVQQPFAKLRPTKRGIRRQTS